VQVDQTFWDTLLCFSFYGRMIYKINLSNLFILLDCHKCGSTEEEYTYICCHIATYGLWPKCFIVVVFIVSALVAACECY
jgi:hypothetical protein